MFKTHYAKQTPKARWDEDKGPLLTPVESLLYNIAEMELLFTKDFLFGNFLHKLREKPEEYSYMTKQRSDVDRAIEGLVQKGFLKEIHGARIGRFLASF
jgi:hypothetical protein